MGNMFAVAAAAAAALGVALDVMAWVPNYLI